MAAVEADDLPQLHRFVSGLRRDYDAVLNGLTLPHSSGSVEGNRIRMIKRQMYGRSNFDLLRKRVLLAAGPTRASLITCHLPLQCSTRLRSGYARPSPR
jgi:hypothetical protein